MPATDPLKVKPDRVTLNYKTASDKHVAFHNAWRTETRIVNGGVGTGKTVMVAYEILDQLLSNPLYRGRKALVVGLTAGHVRDLLIPEFLKIMRNEYRGRPSGLIEGRHYKIAYAPTNKIELYGNGFVSTIQFASLESRDTLRGFNVSITYCDDIGSTDEEAWNTVCDRAGREGAPEMMIGTCNPGAPSHWIYRRYFEKFFETGLMPEKVYLDTFTMYDNPTLKHKWAGMEARYAHDPVEFARKILGQWRGRDGLVYSNFNRDVHVLKRPTGMGGIKQAVYTRPDMHFLKSSPISVGIDFGGRDATAMVWVAKHENSFYVFKEYYSTDRNATIKTHADYLKRQPYHVLNYYSDHYTETVNTYREHGVQLRLADKGPGSIVNGIALINQLFAENRLFIVDECENTIRELESYEWQTKGQDKPKDANNHAMDALRYVLFEIAQPKNLAFEAYFHADLPASVQSALPSHTVSNNDRPATAYLKDLKAAEDAGTILVGYEPNGKPIYARG